jgi:hypothetical protein
LQCYLLIIKIKPTLKFSQPKLVIIKMIISKKVCTAVLCLLATSLTFAQGSFKVNAGKDAHLCIGAYLELHATTEGGEAPFTFLWTPNAELNEASSADIIATPTYTTTYHVEATDAKGRKAHDDVEIEVYFRPSVLLPSSISIAPGESATLSAQVNGANGAITYMWKPAVGLSSASSDSPVATPNSTTTYTLRVKDSKGCIVTEQVSVEVKAHSSTEAGGR